MSFDPPGTWESPGDINLYTITNYLKAVNELIDYYEKPAFVIGHSRGGSIAMLAGTTNPNITHFASIMSYYSFKPENEQNADNKNWGKMGINFQKGIYQEVTCLFGLYTTSIYFGECHRFELISINQKIM